ncbi:MAG: NAD(P)/FAD-dependent oxidoreductase [Planctomycetota bacterium]|nr:NAD(P)/FAD-dependent oxidoreductase [Planctomycetota bacterium]
MSPSSNGMPPRPHDADVLIVGAGPGGTTAAGLLAQQGFDVLVLEKDEFPREKIGESLLPGLMPILARLGVEPEEETYVYKRGARFVCEHTEREQAFEFQHALPGAAEHAWHVDRARFDTQLRDRAVTLGADVRHGETVTDLGVDARGAWVQTRSARVRGRYLIDTSGQSRLMARRNDAVEPYTRFGHCAAYTHFHDARVDQLGPDFDIRIMLRPEGWGWIIPLPGGRISVGIVAKGKVTKEDLDCGLLAGPLCARLTKGATRAETHVVGNYSYANTQPSGARFAAAGDAACFLDPVFSSGVTLAMRGAADLVDVLAPALRAGAEDDPTLLAGFHESMDRAYRTFAGLVERFYNTRFAESYFLGSDLGADLRRGVMSVLAGDVWRHDNPFQDMLLSARRRRGAPTAN